MFHQVKGNNITLDQNQKTAHWEPVETGGLVFTDVYILPEQPIILKLEGSGAVELGVISYAPNSLQHSIPESADKLADFVFLNDVKIHKRTCTMTIKLDAENKEILTSYGGGQYKQSVDCNKRYWLIADVKYGQVEMKLCNEESQTTQYQFSDICGTNIKRLNDPCQASSLRKSPASHCFSRNTITKDSQYVIRCMPRPFQETIPGRFYLTLYYTQRSPEQFYEQNMDKFDVSYQENNQQASNQDLIEIEKFEKEECTVKPILISYDGEKFSYKSSTGKRGSHHVTNTNSELRFVFELYGVSVTLDCIEPRGGVTRFSDVSPIMADIPEDPVGGSSVRLEADIDDPVHLEEPIRKHFTTLRDSFTVDEFIDNMYEQNLLTERELIEISRLCETSKHQATKKVLIRLSNCPVSKKFMLDALEKTKQSYLCKYFFPSDDKN